MLSSVFAEHIIDKAGVHGAENGEGSAVAFIIVGLEMQRIEIVQKTLEVPQLPSPLGGPVLGQGC